MKRLTLRHVAVYLTLALILGSLLAVTPVLASDGMTCPDHAATVASLRACVLHAAEMGHIDNRGVTNSLLAKLDAAQRALDRGQAAVAIATLQAFINEVEAQAGKHIDAEHAAHMVMHANEVITALS
ncbi:MAG TPA: hypothetical protein PKE45_23275 [Caldilineaceae bacterium]|nr:hypothetical protein [Caldilineaceae bacterium]